MLAALILPKSAAAGIITAQLLYINIVKYIQFKVQFNIKFAEIMSKIAKSVPMQISVSSPDQTVTGSSGPTVPVLSIFLRKTGKDQFRTGSGPNQDGKPVYIFSKF